MVALEERQKEQETAGWVLRKGEVVWVWLSDNPEAEEAEEAGDDALIDGDGGLWVAGVVAERPSFTPPYQKVRKATGNAFADIDMDDTPPTWQQENGNMAEKTYIVQLCSNPPKLGQILKGVPQHYVKPWLSRRECAQLPPSYSGKIEHPSIPQARRVAETFSLFDRVANPATATDSSSAPIPNPDTQKIANFQGIFIGAEKIYIHEPVRISSANTDESEDVLVVDKIYTCTTTSEGVGSNGDGKKKTLTTTQFRGNVYTAYPSTTCIPLSSHQFTELPFRMRRGSGTGEIIKWFIRNIPEERGECSLKMILGRWYEPQAVDEWTGSTGFAGGQPSSREKAMCQKEVKRWVKNRADALGLVSVNGVDLKSEGEVKIQPGKLTNPLKPKPDDATVDVMDVDEPRQVTPERGFKSVNMRISSVTPGSASSLKKTPGRKVGDVESGGGSAEEGEQVAEIEDEDEDEDEATMSDDKYHQSGPGVLSRSPTKRLSR